MYYTIQIIDKVQEMKKLEKRRKIYKMFVNKNGLYRKYKPLGAKI